tara:strand:+ start:1595 stop:1846 length:252 start_codon:yes stop_codon:yes gene_type:complete
MISFLKSLFGAGEKKTLKLSDYVANKKRKVAPLILVPSKADMSKMTKAKLEEMGRNHGIELDKRLTKDKLVTQLRKHMNAKNK